MVAEVAEVACGRRGQLCQCCLVCYCCQHALVAATTRLSINEGRRAVETQAVRAGADFSKMCPSFVVVSGAWP